MGLLRTIKDEKVDAPVCGRSRFCQSWTSGHDRYGTAVGCPAVLGASMNMRSNFRNSCSFTTELQAEILRIPTDRIPFVDG